MLQEVELRVWSNQECQTAWRGAFDDPSFTLLASQLCASNPGKDTCSGDSGGPLQMMVRRVTGEGEEKEGTGKEGRDWKRKEGREEEKVNVEND